MRVRQAVNYAINRDAILKAVYQGAGRKAKNPIPPTIWSYNDAVKDYPYDPAKAKALLAAAGLKDGFKAKLWAMPVQRPYNPNAKLMAEMMQADLKKVGIDVDIVSYEWGEYLKRTKNGEHDMVLLGWTGDNGDPDNFLYPLLSCDSAKAGNNRSRWCDKTFNDLIVQAKQTSDLKKRTALYKQAQDRVQGPGALGHDRALGGLRADPQERGQLQGRSVRAARLQRRRSEVRSTEANSVVPGEAWLKLGFPRRLWISTDAAFRPDPRQPGDPDFHRDDAADLRHDSPHSGRSHRNPRRRAWHRSGAPRDAAPSVRLRQARC